VGTLTVNPEVLKWARKERRLTEADAAERLEITEAALADLESGVHVPNITELRHIATKYRITFAALLMPEPLPNSTRPTVKDFRTDGGMGATYDHDMMVELEDINQQLDLLADLRGHEPELFGERAIPMVSVNDNPTTVAATERESFAIPVNRQLGWRTPMDAFLVLRAAIERRGIFVYARNLGTPRNCRGFSVFDERNLPTIVVNSSGEEEYGPRNFTLLHEYGHILLREAGISDQNRQNIHERFCNQFAADFLMPRQPFRRFAETLIAPDRRFNDEMVGVLAKRFKVSKSAAAIHLETVGLAPEGFYQDLKEAWRKRAKANRRGGISSYAEKVVNAYGVRHVGLVMEALQRRKIDELDAHEMLNVKSEHFDAIRQTADERQEVYGGGR
jgi:Zn-dependent peptidase ImmA (M78 family)/DNA-binding XRE family transcriptional regulator